MFHKYLILLFSLTMFARPYFVFGQDTETPLYTYRVLHTYPHDSQAFTQGLVYHQGYFYESTGLWGQSTLRKIQLDTGKVLQVTKLDSQYFGEGLTLWKDQLLQLTWKSKVGFVYQQDTFNLLKTFSYSTEGWGLTHDGTQLIMSDGTDTLYFLNPTTFEVTQQLQVRDQNTPVTHINELEYVQGELFANIWLTNYIARISLQTGQVLGWIDLTGLSPFPKDNLQKVLNGIAYDEVGKRLFVTGKWWPTLFEMEILPCSQRGRGNKCYPFKR